MAYQEYNDTQSLNDMTTRQLRLYISRKSTEAQKRIDSMDLKKSPHALQEQAYYITDRNGSHVKRSTSNMSKAEMVEYAYQLREFNLLDTTSKYSRDIEWIENKARYEKFIRETQNPNKNPYYSEEFAKYWKQFILEPSGRISKKGYKEYKRYIEFVRAVGKEKEMYGYRDFKADVVKLLVNRKRFKAINNMLNDVFMGNNENLSVEKMVERVDTMVAIYDERAQARLKRQNQNKTLKKVAKATKPKTKTKKSTNIVKTKTAGKMKTNATIRERIN